jgi:hypothetical protein
MIKFGGAAIKVRRGVKLAKWRRRLIWAVGVLALTTFSTPSAAQPVAIDSRSLDTTPVVRVAVDLAAAAFDRDLPFDVPFFIAGTAPEGVLSLEVQYALTSPSADSSNLLWLPREPFTWRPDTTTTSGQPFLLLIRTPLAAKQHYLVRFSFLREGSIRHTVTAEGHTAFANHISADAGTLYAGDIGIGALYIGSNIYFRPVNRDAPNEVGSIGRRLAATVGITISPTADERSRRRSDLFWNQSLVLGAGYRLTSFLRGGGGALIFLESDVNPLITQKNLAATWYVSLSLDLDVASLLH